MLIKTFWIIVVKIIGLWLLTSCFYVIPQFFVSITMGIVHSNISLGIFAWLGVVFGVSVYAAIALFLIFKSEWFLRKLKLDQNFSEETISLQMKLPVVLSIAIILIGGIVVADALPDIVREIARAIRSRRLNLNDFDYSYAISAFVRFIIGMYFLMFSRSIAIMVSKNQYDQFSEKHD